MPRTEAPHPELFDPVTPIADINLEQAPALEFFYFFPHPLVGLEVELLPLDGFFAASYRENMAVERRLAVGVLDKINGFIKKRVLTESAFRGPVGTFSMETNYGICANGHEGGIRA